MKLTNDLIFIFHVEVANFRQMTTGPPGFDSDQSNVLLAR